VTVTSDCIQCPFHTGLQETITAIVIISDHK